MGLDMYLHAERYLYSYPENGPDQLIASRIAEASSVPYGRVKEVKVEVAYWRKSNQIHAWFVKNVQDGEDDCGDHYVSRENLQDLLTAVTESISHKDKAVELLPTQGGFFFGSTDIDEWYWKGLEETSVKLREILSAFPDDSQWSFSYHSSW